MSVITSFGSFEANAMAEGFDEVIERERPPNGALDFHTHPYSVHAVISKGEMWLRVGDGEEEHLRPGDQFALEPGEPHAERYGPEGVVYWAARRTPA